MAMGAHTGDGEDRISSLPDEMLHGILVDLRSASAAARTSVLSRRWQHLWRHIPELDLDDSTDAPPPPSSFLDSVDGALAGYSAPNLERLTISLMSRDDDGDGDEFGVLPRRVAPWLRFAAERVAGKLVLFMPPHRPRTMPPHDPELLDGEDEAALELPVCERAKTIALFLEKTCSRLRLRPAGLFMALTNLVITFARIEGSELTALVCTRCPRLRDLTLVVDLVAISDVSLRSDSLHKLVFFIQNTRRLEVLEVSCTVQAHISAPNLAEIIWRGITAYNPLHHRFAGVGRRLLVLKISSSSIVASLITRFDEVDELTLEICIPQVCYGIW
jgi:hypothetical protein